MTHFFIIFVLLITTLNAATWVDDGMSFYAADGLLKSNKDVFKEKSRVITSHVRFLMGQIPQSTQKKIDLQKIGFIFENTSGVDALFMMPGIYNGELKRQILDKRLIVINPNVFEDLSLLRLITHEFFHLVHSLENPNEEDWIKEGLAQFFEYKIHHGISGLHVLTALTESMYPLNSPFNPTDYSPEKYGNSFLFIHYFTRYCGGDDAFWTLMKITNLSGLQSLDQVIGMTNKDNKICESTTSLIENFILAKMVNDTTGSSSVDSYLLWPTPTMMETGTDLGEEISQLPPETLKDFLSRLQPYLGIKIPSNKSKWISDKNFVLMTSLSFRIYLVSKNFPRKIKLIKAYDQLTFQDYDDLIIFKIR